MGLWNRKTLNIIIDSVVQENCLRGHPEAVLGSSVGPRRRITIAKPHVSSRQGRLVETKTERIFRYYPSSRFGDKVSQPAMEILPTLFG